PQARAPGGYFFPRRTPPATSPAASALALRARGARGVPSSRRHWPIPLASCSGPLQWNNGPAGWPRPVPPSMNNLHPIFHGQSHHAGSRLDIERTLPVNIEDEDVDLLLEDLSEPPRYEERLAPVGMQVGEESVRGKNFTDMLVKAYRMFARIYAMITMSIEQALRNNFRERGMVPF